MAAAERTHYLALDGLRGLAAFTVMLGHIAYVWHDSPLAHGTLKRALVAVSRTGHPAVLLFFALSGFVLYLAYRKNTSVPYVVYLTKRLFRIYPALLGALTIALVLLVIQHPGPDPALGPWTQAQWVFQPTFMQVLRNVLLLGFTVDDNRLDPVIWSLVVEVRFSIVFPLLAMIAHRNRWFVLVVAAAAFIPGILMVETLGLRPPLQVGVTATGSLALFLIYLPAFCFGIFAADFFVAGRVTWKPHPVVQVGLVLGLLVAGKLLNSELGWSLVAALLITLACTKGPFHALLTAPPSLFLGRISYSLYLVHFPVIMFCAYAFAPHTSILVGLAVASVASILMATAMYRWIELPGMALGRVLARRLQKDNGVAQASA